ASDLRLRLRTGGTGIPKSHYHDIWHQCHGKLGRARSSEIYPRLVLVDLAAGFAGRTTRRFALSPDASGTGAYRTRRTTTLIALLQEAGGLAICCLLHGGVVPFVSWHIRRGEAAAKTSRQDKFP